MKWIFTLSLLLSLLEVNSQTVVIARKTKNAIYVGADSRLTIKAHDLKTGAEYTDTNSICKIITVGKFNIAFAGYNITEAVRSAKLVCSYKKNILDAMDSFSINFGTILVTR